MSRRRLNERQLDVLRRIGDEVRPVTSREFALATSVYALRNRGLVTTKRGGGIWTAAITEAGRYYLEHGRHPADTPKPQAERREPAVAPKDQRTKRPAISGDELVEQVTAAGGSLRIPDPEPATRAAWRRAIHAAARSSSLPAGMRLWHTGRDKGDLVIRLLPRRAPSLRSPQDAPTIAVPERLTRPHPIVTQLKELSAARARASRYGHPALSGPYPLRGLDVSRQHLPRALRILQALLTEAERRGYEVRLHKESTGPRVGIVIRGHECAVTVREKDDLLRVVLPAEYSGRRVWSDGVRAAVEDKLGDLLANIEARAEEAEQRRLEWERRQEERRQAWERAMESARERFIDDHRASVLRDQVAAWRLAAEIRAFCSAAQTVSPSTSASGAQEAEEWLAWATAYADAIDPLGGSLSMPESPDPSPDDLRPYVHGWNPYGPM